jgi:hypothetical protein
VNCQGTSVGTKIPQHSWTACRNKYCRDKKNWKTGGGAWKVCWGAQAKPDVTLLFPFTNKVITMLLSPWIEEKSQRKIETLVPSTSTDAPRNKIVWVWGMLTGVHRRAPATSLLLHGWPFSTVHHCNLPPSGLTPRSAPPEEGAGCLQGARRGKGWRTCVPLRKSPTTAAGEPLRCSRRRPSLIAGPAAALRRSRESGLNESGIGMGGTGH